MYNNRSKTKKKNLKKIKLKSLEKSDSKFKRRTAYCVLLTFEMICMDRAHKQQNIVCFVHEIPTLNDVMEFSKSARTYVWVDRIIVAATTIIPLQYTQERSRKTKQNKTKQRKRTRTKIHWIQK